MLLLSIILINLALIFYTFGVWSERIARLLKIKHVFLFWTGLFFDACGTLAMHYISDKPFNLFESHTLSGQMGLWLMFAHAIWATRVVLAARENKLKNFHKYSIIVWLIWLIPYFGGIYISIK